MSEGRRYLISRFGVGSSLYRSDCHLFNPRGNQTLLVKYVENKLQEALKQDKGMGCEVPQLDPFAREITQFNDNTTSIKCDGHDWVRCYHSKCRVVDSIKDTYTDIKCTYKDILYHSDDHHSLGMPRRVAGSGSYELKESDHVKVTCVGRRRNDGFPENTVTERSFPAETALKFTALSRCFVKNHLGTFIFTNRGSNKYLVLISGKKAVWSGKTLGFRPVTPPAGPAGREHTHNVVVFGFDSVSRVGFIRHMPKTWQALKDIGATVMEGYNIVGDSTSAAMFPILTGKTELELPDVRRGEGVHSNGSLDTFPFVFNKLKQDGYRTAYFEDMIHIGTFQYRFKGFRRQPADHYLNAFYREVYPQYVKNTSYCVGDTPGFKLLFNITQQFLELGGKRFIFMFSVSVSHDDSWIQVADDDTSAFLRGLMEIAEDTLIIAMSDHGPRFAKVRQTFQGKLEERLPLLAIRLPSRLARERPRAQQALKSNARTLTTPHDVYATIMDVLDLRQHWNPYRVRGADLTRGLTILEPIPRQRSCSEAGIEPHWCSCLVWRNVSTDDPFYTRPAKALVDYINSLVNEVGGLCVRRTLVSTEWVLRQRANSGLLASSQARDYDQLLGNFTANTTAPVETFQTKIVVGPGRGVYEASMTYLVKDDQFVINTREISRTNAYGQEPSCIIHSHPHLAYYCYCR